MAITVNSVRPFLLFSIISLLISTILGFLGDWFWIFDLFSHFRLQYLIIGIALFSLCALYLRPLGKAHFGVFLIVLLNFTVVAPFYLAKRTPLKADQGIKIVSINLNRLNRDMESLESYLQEANPDYISFFELTPEWAQKIKGLRATYPHAHAVLQSDNFGIGIISKFPLNNPIVVRDPILQIPLLSVDSVARGLSFKFIAVHPFPPINPTATASRNLYLSEFSSSVAGMQGPIVVCGDMNASPWSNIFREVLDKSGLKAPKGFGVVGTWPSAMFPFAIPIDHCLTSNDLSVVEFKKGFDIGSDHFPIELTVQPNGERETSSSR